MKNNNGASIRRLSDRSLKNNRMRNVFAILAIALTGLLFTAVFSLTSGGAQVMQEETMREVGGRFHAGLKMATEEQYEKVIADPLIKKYSYDILIGVADNIRKRQAELRYTPDEDSLEDMFITLKEGHMPVEKNEIIVDTFVLDELKLPHTTGVTVPLTFRFLDKTIEDEFIVSGYYQGDAISHASELFLSESYWMTLKGSWSDEDFLRWGQEHPQDAHVGLRAVNLFFQNDSHLEEKVKTVIQNAGYIPGEELKYGVNWAYMSSRMEAIDPLTAMIIGVAILVILITGYLIIYNIFQISVISDIRFYGLLKTIGATRKQLRRLIRRQAALLSLIGIPIGLILGYGTGAAILPLVFRIADSQMKDIALEMNPWIFIFGAGFSALTVFLSCRRPGRIAGNVSPIEAVRYTEPIKVTKRDKKRRTRFSAFSMALSNLGRHKRTTIVVTAAISFSIILLAIIMTAINGFQLDQYLEQRIVGDFLAANVNTTSMSARSADCDITPEYLAFADNLDGIESRGEMWVNFGRYLQINGKAITQYQKLAGEGKLRQDSYNAYNLEKILNGESSMDGFFYSYTENMLDNLTVLDGKLDIEKFSTGDYILLGQLLGNDHIETNEHVYHPGDLVTVEFITDDTISHEITNEAGELIGVQYENLGTKEYEVMAIVDIPYSMNLRRYSMNCCDAVLPITELNASSQCFAVSYQVQDEYQKNFEDALKEYTETIDPQMGFSSKASLQAEFETIIFSIAAIGMTLSVVIAFIGILNFINAMITEIISRRREFAMLQSIGMTNAQLKKTLIYEGLCYIGISGVISFVLGSVLSKGILNALNNVVLFFEYRFQILPFIIMLPLLMLVATLTPLFAYSRMRKKSLVERLGDAE
ncbi:MAG: ABC transporter permease [Blautia sp.]|nr:ABC transporter permease [Lachnoclostridium sp.]MCM1211368.1 ABC transporter permease [Blautia sp.]